MPGAHPGAEPSVSFRDPAGRLVVTDGRVLRFVNAGAAEALTSFLHSTTARALVAEDSLVRAEVLVEELGPELVLEHERITWPSYPYEWPVEMLHSAAVRTLDIAERLLPEGYGLKDATPYNILFRGPRPVFVDWLSFERRRPEDPTWIAGSQFNRTFLLPLLVAKRLKTPPQPFLLARRDGLEPEEVYRWLSPLGRLAPDALSLVSIPAWLSKRQEPTDVSIYRPRLCKDRDQAGFVLRALFRRLRRALARLEPGQDGKSAWAGYMEGHNNYTQEQFQAKERFVAEAVARLAPSSVLDVGCNTGHFSRLAARCGAEEVVAIDSDPVAAGRLWRTASAEKLNILPLVVDITRPSPGVGWRNRECPGFLERAANRFDAVLCLAVLHHVLVSERVPLEDFLDLVAELTRNIAIVEFVAPEDSMFRAIARGRDELHRDLNTGSFEAECARRFRIDRSLRLPGSHRWLYLLRR
jgi:ribosomal protein L11 methylase PrmA